MPTTVRDLIESRQELVLVTVVPNDLVQTAIEKMLENNFSQLPVIDNEGKLMGMVTSNSILRALKNFGVTIDKLRVSHAMFKVSKQYRVDDDLSPELLDDLMRNNALLIENQTGKITGIVTIYDASFILHLALSDCLSHNFGKSGKEAIAISRSFTYLGNIQQF